MRTSRTLRSLLDKEFQKSRMRFYRRDSHEIESGWVQEVTPNELSVFIKLSKPIKEGDEVLVHIFGSKSDAVFLAKYATSSPNTSITGSGPTEVAHFKLLSSAKFFPVERQGRKRAEGYPANLAHRETDESVMLLDVSLKGIAFLCETIIKMGEQAELNIETQYGDVLLSINVRNSSPIEASGKKMFRIGATATVIGRLAEVAWRKFIECPCDIDEQEAA